jgi:hypothetical protein
LCPGGRNYRRDWDEGHPQKLTGNQTDAIPHTIGRLDLCLRNAKPEAQAEQRVTRANAVLYPAGRDTAGQRGAGRPQSGGRGQGSRRRRRDGDKYFLASDQLVGLGVQAVARPQSLLGGAIAGGNGGEIVIRQNHDRLPIGRHCGAIGGRRSSWGGGGGRRG